MAEVAAYVGHDDEGKPALVLHRKVEPEGRRCFIKLQDAWLFSEDHNPGFEDHIRKVTEIAYDYLLGQSIATSEKIQAQRMAEIATLIEERIDDLINHPPAEEDKGEVVDDVKMTIGDQTVEAGITSKGHVTDA